MQYQIAQYCKIKITANKHFRYRDTRSVQRDFLWIICFYQQKNRKFYNNEVNLKHTKRNKSILKH